MNQMAFAEIPTPARQEKPRTAGLTMMIDWGIPAGQQADIIASAGHLIDKAKVAGGIPRFMPYDLLKQKLEMYRSAGISTANGGLFTELALKQGTYDILLTELCELGFAALEVSENLIVLSAAEKTKAVRHAREAYGLQVLGEVGRKEGTMSDDEIIQDVEIYLNAGVQAVYLEAYEMFDGPNPREDLIRRLSENFPAEALIFELPVVILPGTTRDIKHQVAAQMVSILGTEVNLANVEHDELYLLECVRCGMAGDTSHPEGAYRLAGIGDTGQSRDSKSVDGSVIG